MPRCRKCTVEKPLEEFRGNVAGGYVKTCLLCRAKKKARDARRKGLPSIAVRTDPGAPPVEVWAKVCHGDRDMIDHRAAAWHAQATRIRYEEGMRQ